MPLTFETLLDEPPAGAAADAGRARRVGDVEAALGVLRRAPAPPMPRARRTRRRLDEPSECARRATRGVRLMTLGRRTLRADAVPVAAISVLQFLWGDF